MDKTGHCGQNGEKLNAIIDTAQKRFGIYGLEKTTMREIANDLNMSKGSLYYYFPDKEHLYKAVIEKEQCVFLNIIKEKIQIIENPRDLLREYVKTRLHYFKLLLNLGQLRLEAFKGIKTILGDIWLRFREKEKEVLVTIFNKGIDAGIYKKLEPEKTAELFLDLVKGLRETVIIRKNLMYISEEEYENLLEKVTDFTEIFINGITKY